MAGVAVLVGMVAVWRGLVFRGPNRRRVRRWCYVRHFYLFSV
ncbi:hypothetical protein ACNKHV_11450 [Shigella flexneri]